MPSFPHCFSSLDASPDHSNRAYKSQDAPLPRDLLGNKEPFLRGRGAVHLLSDARRCKSRPSREFPRTRPLGPLAGKSQAGVPALGRHGSSYATASGLSALPPPPGSFGARPRLGMALGRAGVSQVLSPRPLAGVLRSKVLRLGARARRGLEMMSQERGAFLVPLPHVLGVCGGQARWAGGWTRQAEGRTRRPDIRLSRLLLAGGCKEPFQGGSGTAHTQPLRSPADL